MNEFLFLILLILSQACVGEKKSNLTFSTPESRNGGLTVNDQETFEGLKAKVLLAKCISCHQNFSTEEGISKMVVPKKPEMSKLFTTSLSGEMPKGAAPLSTLELEIIASYINNLKVSPTLPSGKVDFLAIQTQILNPSCVQCHQGMTSEKNLMRWVDLRKPLISIFLKVVKSGSMPKGGAMLPPKDQELIRSYLRSFIR